MRHFKAFFFCLAFRSSPKIGSQCPLSSKRLVRISRRRSLSSGSNLLREAINMSSISYESSQASAAAERPRWSSWPAFVIASIGASIGFVRNTARSKVDDDNLPFIALTPLVFVTKCDAFYREVSGAFRSFAFNTAEGPFSFRICLRSSVSEFRSSYWNWQWGSTFKPETSAHSEVSTSASAGLV